MPLLFFVGYFLTDEVDRIFSFPYLYHGMTIDDPWRCCSRVPMCVVLFSPSGSLTRPVLFGAALIFAISFVFVFVFVPSSPYPSMACMSAAQFQVVFVLSALLSYLINLATFWCTQANSALTVSVSGQAKNVVVTIIGTMIFNVPLTPMLIAGLCLGLLGSFMYGMEEYQQAQAQQPAKLSKEVEMAIQKKEEEETLLKQPSSSKSKPTDKAPGSKVSRNSS